MKFESFGELIAGESYICSSALSNEELAQGHDELMECPVNYVYWRELDEELAYRCDADEHDNPMEWPY